MPYFQEIYVVRLESANDGPGTKSLPQPVLVNKVLLAQSPAHSWPHHWQLRASKTEPSSCDRGHVTCEAQNSYYLTLRRKLCQHPVVRDARMKFFNSLRIGTQN